MSTLARTLAIWQRPELTVSRGQTRPEASAPRSRLAAAAAAGFVLSTLGGYLLSVWVGLFGFKEVRTTAGTAAGLIEVAAFAALALTALAPGPVRQAGRHVSPGARLLDHVQAAAPRLIGAALSRCSPWRCSASW